MTDGQSLLAGKAVFILEDEFFIALDAADTLKMSGAVVVGPCYAISEALDLLDASHVDAAVLDVNIDGHHSDQVAQLCSSKGIPIVYTTGYGNRAKVSSGIQILDKPYTGGQLVDAIAAVLDTQRRK